MTWRMGSWMRTVSDSRKSPMLKRTRPSSQENRLKTIDSVCLRIARWISAGDSTPFSISSTP
jgi:hypothetical protein